VDLKKAAEVIKKHQAIIDEFVDLTRRRRELKKEDDEIKARLIRIGGGREGPRDKCEFFEGELLLAMQALGLKNFKSDGMTLYIKRAFGVSCKNGHGRAVELLKQVDEAGKPWDVFAASNDPSDFDTSQEWLAAYHKFLRGRRRSLFIEEKANTTLLKNVTKELIAEAEMAGEPISAEEALAPELRDEFSVFEELTLSGRESRSQKGE